ncbi:MAG: GTPase [Planctomycetes bacterium]|nr:GTPase [Planctomycetota bacterium]
MPNLLILGAAGKDFHVFNTCYRHRDDVRVVAFTATQIPDIAGRCYPPQLAGPRYPSGIPIHPEEEFVDLIRRHHVDEVVFSYSDVSYEQTEERRRKAEAAGARFSLAPVEEQMLRSTKKVVAVCAVRTGSGKSQTSRRVADILRARGRRVSVMRHPMPYGDLLAQEVQRFATIEDLERQKCTIEEMEEFEPHLKRGSVVFAGVDYEKVLRAAEAESDVVLWDGGNNDTPFVRPDLWICVADPLRPGHELTFYPGRVNFDLAHAIVVNKCDSAKPADIESVIANARQRNPKAAIVRANSPIFCEQADAIRGKRVLCVEDGPTLTHGHMTFGAGVVAAKKFGAAALVDPRPFVTGRIAETFRLYPKIGTLLPAMGYGRQQMEDLAATINRCDADLVIVATPIDLARIVRIEKPSVRVTYELEEIGKPGIAELLAGF